MRTEDHLEDNRMGDDVDMYQKYLKLHESVKEMYLCTVKINKKKSVQYI